MTAICYTPEYIVIEKALTLNIQHVFLDRLSDAYG